MKSDAIRTIEDDLKIMQQHIEKQDHANETYMLENDKLRREIENIKAIEGNLRTTKQQLEDEKTIRVT
jgi:regulator of replication initiation timing